MIKPSRRVLHSCIAERFLQRMLIMGEDLLVKCCLKGSSRTVFGVDFQRPSSFELQMKFNPWPGQAYLQGEVDDGNIVLHRGSGAVVFSDASGFTALTERLAKKTNGAELLSQCLTSFFTPLIQLLGSSQEALRTLAKPRACPTCFWPRLINAYRGDVIKFSGDALMIYFPAVDDTEVGDQSKFKVPPHGSYHQPDRSAVPLPSAFKIKPLAT